jgi:hypothetical protein
MKKGLLIYMSALTLASLSGATLAQESDYHPGLQSNIVFSVGAFRSSNSFEISSSGRDTETGDIDFGDSVGVDKDNTILNVQLRWNFGSTRKWSLWGQYFSNDASGDATLEEDVDWQDVTFRKGSFVEAGVKLEVTRLFMGYSFVKNEQHDFGVGAGIHNLDISAYIGGEIIVDDESTGRERLESSNSQILPNIGTWYYYSPAKRWLLHARVDWIGADIGDYSGNLWNTNVGVNFQAWKHVGFDLAWQRFNLNVDVDKTDWTGGVDMTYSGPMLSVTVNW